MKIITRYVLREHAGPLAFAFTALTSLMLLNFISRQFGELVGKGLPWSVIGKFFLLSIPFTVALTVPMSVLVAVLFAYSRLAAENEVTALKANGVSPWRMVTPAILAGLVMSALLLAFNDQVLPRANHELKTLQEDISQTRPTLLLKPQVINAVSEGKLYLKAGSIDNGGGRMKEVVIYDLGESTRRRTIYAQRGAIAFAPNKIDLDLDLYDGEMQEIATEKPNQLSRMFFKHNRIRVRNVGRTFSQSESDSSSKGDREMSICEMQKRFWSEETRYDMAKREYAQVQRATNRSLDQLPPNFRRTIQEPHGIGWVYCTLMKKVGTVRTAHAANVADVALRAWQDTVPRKPVVQPAIVRVESTAATPPVRPETSTAAKPVMITPLQAPAAGPAPVQQPAVGVGQPVLTPLPAGTVPGVTPGVPGPAMDVQARIAAQAAAAMATGNVSTETTMLNARKLEAKVRLDMAQRARNRYDIEIHKKFSLAAACLIFCIVAPPIALRFPRGGVGLVLIVSLVVFALYYVGLIGGESLANKGIVPPFWAMWGTNVIMTLVGLVLLLRMGHESNTGRGGGVREWLDNMRARREDRRAASLRAKVSA